MKRFGIGNIFQAEMIELANPAGQVYWVLYMDSRHSTYSGEHGQLAGNIRGASIQIADGIADNETIAYQAICEVGTSILKHGLLALSALAEEQGLSACLEVPY